MEKVSDQLMAKLMLNVSSLIQSAQNEEDSRVVPIKENTKTKSFGLRFYRASLRVILPILYVCFSCFYWIYNFIKFQ